MKGCLPMAISEMLRRLSNEDVVIGDFPRVARSSFFQWDWRAPLKVNIQFLGAGCTKPG